MSGNPRGRPIGSGSFASIMDAILDEEMRLKINGRSVVVTGRQALGLRMIDRALRGDVRIVQLMHKYGLLERGDQPFIRPFILMLNETDSRL